MVKDDITLDFNEQFRQAIDLMEHSTKSVFITGRAGTGKSTLLQYFSTLTQKNVVILAPTGVAALNVKGQTIHSFFKFKPHVTPEDIRKHHYKNENENIYKKLDTIVIDEISMVRADLLDCVDKFLRLNGPLATQPFGGIQMIFIGDLYQLPPVVTGEEKEIFSSFYDSPYFYSAKVFQDFDFEFVELEKIYRQHDDIFIKLLNSIRNNTIDEDGLRLLNTRYRPDFRPPDGEFYIYLTTTNALAEQINQQQLTRLKGRTYNFTGLAEGEFGDEYLPTAVDLKLKIGAQVMMLNNDPVGRWVNGSLGQITGIEPAGNGEAVIIVELNDGNVVEVTPYTWEIYRYFVAEDNLHSEVVGRFTQYPLILAWAVTIHKSQGKTFDKVIINFGRGTFAHGQAYVALSRCKSLEGIILLQKVTKKHIMMDSNVVRFLTRYQYKKAEDSLSAEEKCTLIWEAIQDGSLLKITYLKPNDEKSRRIILPREVGQMEFQGKTYTGVRAFCLKRQEERNFRIDRILSIKKVRSDTLDSDLI